MALTKQQVADLVKSYGGTEKDTGSPQVQIAALSTRINELTEHLKSHVKDFHARRGLTLMVSKRTNLLRYLERTDRAAYVTLVDKLGLRK